MKSSKYGKLSVSSRQQQKLFKQKSVKLDFLNNLFKWNSSLPLAESLEFRDFLGAPQQLGLFDRRIFLYIKVSSFKGSNK